MIPSRQERLNLLTKRPSRTLGGLQEAAQQAADSSGQGLGQVLEAANGLLENALGGISEKRSEERDEQRVAGKGGDERDVAGIVGDLVKELSDDGTTLENRNLFQKAQDALAEGLGIRSTEESQALRERV